MTARGCAHGCAGVFDGADTQRFYITVANYALAGGQHLGSSALLIAVSATSNPAEGFMGPFSVPTMGLDAGGQVPTCLYMLHQRLMYLPA